MCKHNIYFITYCERAYVYFSALKTVKNIERAKYQSYLYLVINFFILDDIIFLLIQYINSTFCFRTQNILK